MWLLVFGAGLLSCQASEKRSGEPCDEEFARRPAVNPPTSAAPGLANRREAQSQLNSAFGVLGDDVALPRTPMLFVLIDQAGIARRVLLARSSGVVALDSSLIGVVERIRFTPAEHNGVPQCYWATIPFARPMVARGGSVAQR